MAMTATTGRATSTPATASAIVVRRGRRGWDRGMGNSLLFSLLQAISIAEAAPRLMIFSPKFAPGGDACFRAYDVNSLRYVRQRTESPAASAYNGSHREQDIRLTVMRRKTMSTRLSRTTLQLLGALAIAVAAVGCASDKTPATADVAVSRAAVDSATSSGAAELAPAELTSARDKMMKANQALAAKDYKAAKEWADLAAADAQLAQSKANTAKATSAANEVQQSVNAMRDELNRSNANQQQ